MLYTSCLFQMLVIIINDDDDWIKALFSRIHVFGFAQMQTINDDDDYIKALLSIESTFWFCADANNLSTLMLLSIL